MERLAPVALSLVVIVPDRRIPTTQAYAGLQRGATLATRKSLSRATRRMLEAVRSGEPAAIAGALHSDFEALEMVAMKDAREAKQALLGAGCLGALVSGSGSAVFGIAADEAAATEIADRLRERWRWVRVAATVPAEESMVMAAGGEEQ